MAFPQVQTTALSEETNNVTEHTVNLPSGIVSGDLLVVWFGFASIDTGFTFPAGWNLLDSTFVTLLDTAVYYRIADGTEGSTITVTTDDAHKSGVITHRIDGTSGNAPELAVATPPSGNDKAPNPPDLTPSWGAKDTLWLAGFISSQADWVATPANYTDLVLTDHWNLFGQNAVAEYENNATSENPAAYTSDFDALWVAHTLAVEPAAASLNNDRISSMHFQRHYEPIAVGI